MALTQEVLIAQAGTSLEHDTGFNGPLFVWYDADTDRFYARFTGVHSVAFIHFGGLLSWIGTYATSTDWL